MLLIPRHRTFTSRPCSTVSSQSRPATSSLTAKRSTAASSSVAATRHQHRSTSLHTTCSAVVEQEPAQAVNTNKKAFASFDEMLQGSQTPILVDFYATWCGPCQLMSNVISEVAANYPRAENLQVVKIDIDKYPQLATRMRVQALPTLMLYRGGKQLDRIEGLLDAKMLSQRIRYYLRGLDAKFGRSQR